MAKVFTLIMGDEATRKAYWLVGGNLDEERGEISGLSIRSVPFGQSPDNKLEPVKPSESNKGYVLVVGLNMFLMTKSWFFDDKPGSKKEVNFQRNFPAMSAMVRKKMPTHVEAIIAARQAKALTQKAKVQNESSK